LTILPEPFIEQDMMTVRGFPSASTALLLLFLVASCDTPAPYASLDTPRRMELQQWAGVLARYWTLPEGAPGHPGPLSEASLDSLIASCDATPESWPYLYGCISDSVATLEPPDPSSQR
jgi:hypothetical protein